MELLVHLDDEDLARDYIGIPADIPAAVEIRKLPGTDLPRVWRVFPRPVALADLGTRWATGLESAVLAVPSAVIPQELNYLLNPRHPHFKRIQIGRPVPFAFDPRLWKRSPGAS